MSEQRIIRFSALPGGPGEKIIRAISGLSTNPELKVKNSDSLRRAFPRGWRNGADNIMIATGMLLLKRKKVETKHWIKLSIGDAKGIFLVDVPKIGGKRYAKMERMDDHEFSDQAYCIPVSQELFNLPMADQKKRLVSLVQQLCEFAIFHYHSDLEEMRKSIRKAHCDQQAHMQKVLAQRMQTA